MPKDRLFPAFGDLNPVEDSFTGKTLDFDSTTPMQALRRAALDVYKKDAFANTGPLKGIVLRVDENPIDQEAGSWVHNVYNSLENPEKPPLLLQVKIRIPELHAMLPEPARYGPYAGSSHKVIDMYPTFIAMKEDIEVPWPGDIVYCDYSNRVNMTHPVYMGIAARGPGAVGQETSRDLSNKGRNGLCANPPVGDVVGGGKLGGRSQIPNVSSCRELGRNVFNNNPNGINESAHVDDVNNPPARRFEDAYEGGKFIGQIEIVQVDPKYSTKEVWIAKSQENSFMALINAARDDGFNLKLNSGFRTNDQQKELFRRYGRPRAAPPKRSNHQNGSAYDFANMGNGDTAAYRWMANNGWRFGFVNVGREFKKPEPWHYLQVGAGSRQALEDGKIPFKVKKQSFV